MADIDQNEVEKAKGGNMTVYSLLVRAHGKEAVDKAIEEFKPDDGTPVVEKNNPFRKGPSFNLTAQGRIFRTDPALAARLARAAGVRLG
jgi:hypothetical protein